MDHINITNIQYYSISHCHVRLLMMPVVSMTSASMPTYRPINYTIYFTTCYAIVELHGNCLKYITSHLQTLNMFFF